MNNFFSLENISDAVGIGTPIILFFWFYYSQRQQLAKNYFSEIDGIYAGFTEPISEVPDKKGLYAGVIMNIRETDDKGYFKGEFDFAETFTETAGNKVGFRNIRDGIVGGNYGQNKYRIQRLCKSMTEILPSSTKP